MKRLNKKKKKINYDKVINNRFIIFFVVTIILFSIVTIRLIDVIFINSAKYSEELSYLTHTEVSGTSSPRGRIYDRNYNVIVDNNKI